jgi:hypothetical protein
MAKCYDRLVPPQLNMIVGISMIGLLLSLATWASHSKDWRGFAIEAAAIVGAGVFLHALLGFPYSPVVAKGAEDLVLAVALYICMLGGMLAQYAYRFLQRPKSRRN